MAKRILIVDDEESVAFFLAEHLTELGADYQVETARSGEEALALMDRQSFDLIVTDLRMPGINGLDLIEQARRRSPHTRLILMTAYGNQRVETTAYQLGACRYLAKPFRIQDLVSAVQAALTEVQMPGRDILVLSDDQFDEISHCLTDLRFELNAQCVLLADVTGRMLAHLGDVKGVDLQVLISLISGSFATAFEMARYLGEDEALTLNYHEGGRLDVYSANVNEEVFVALLFDKERQRSRIGMVWLYTRRALQQLRDLFHGAERMSAVQVLGEDFGEQLSESLDQLWAGPLSGHSEPAQASDDAEQEITLEEATLALQNSLAAEQTPPADPPAATQTLDFDQALKMGLLDPSWGNDTGDGI